MTLWQTLTAALLGWPVLAVLAAVALCRLLAACERWDAQRSYLGRTSEERYAAPRHERVTR